MSQDTHAGGDTGLEDTPPPPLSAVEINQLLHDVAKDVSARVDALAKQVDELDAEFEARAAAGDDDDDDLRARLAELSRMKEELLVEFETRLMDLDAMVMARLAALRAASGEDDAAASEFEDEDSSAAAAELFEDGSD